MTVKYESLFSAL